jgi:hypothetical protein
MRNSKNISERRNKFRISELIWIKKNTPSEKVLKRRSILTR